MDDFEQKIGEGMRRMGLDPSPGVVARLAQHVIAVLEANATMNLTSIAASDAVPLHVLDSLSAIPFLDGEVTGPFADLGSGGGYPGIPVAIVSGRPVVLVESIGKKAAFLESVCAALRLEATVRCIRAEELALEMSGSFVAVMARAVSALPSLVELAAPLLADRGVLVCPKGRPEKAEIDRGDAVAALCGLVRERAEAVTVPGVDAARTIVVYRKVAASRMALPRRVGLAQRQPLA